MTISDWATVNFATCKFGDARRTCRDVVIANINPLNQRSTTVYNAASETISQVNPLGYRTSSIYDGAGRLLASIDARQQRTTTIYDPAGQSIATVNALAQRSTTLYDPDGRAMVSINPLNGRSTTIYNAASRTVAMLDPLNQRSTMLYDLAGRQIATINPLLQRVTTLYNPASQTIATINPLGYRSSTVYDAAGRTIAQVNANGGRVTTVYDRAGQTIANVDPLAHRLTMVYDAAGQQIRQVNPLGLRTTMAYDPAGKLIVKIDPRSLRVSTTYDAASRPAVRNAAGSLTTWTYDAAGQPTITGTSVGRFTRTYDPVGQVVSLTYAYGQVLQWNWNAVGQRSRLIHPEGARTTYSYDANQRMTSLVNPQTQRTTWAYDANGQVVLKSVGNLVTTYVYDPAGRTTAIGAGTFGSLFAYRYDAAGRKQTCIEDSGIRTTWSYDPAGQLKTERANISGFSRTSYTYDPAGNLLVKTVDDDDSFNYTYNAANQQLSNGVYSYTYDLAGNRRSMIDSNDNITTYTYDALNHNIAFESPLGAVVTYTWAPVNKANDERQIERDDGAEIVRYVWDDQTILEEVDEFGIVVAENTVQPGGYGKLISRREDDVTSQYLFDDLGSTRSLFDNSGPADEYRYEAFGRQISSTGSTENPYTWVGEQGYRQDEETGLANLRARDYDPQAARFTTEDPMGLAAGDSNFYRYVVNDPINQSDPSGLKAKYPRRTVEVLLDVFRCAYLVYEDRPEGFWGSRGYLIASFFFNCYVFEERRDALIKANRTLAGEVVPGARQPGQSEPVYTEFEAVCRGELHDPEAFAGNIRTACRALEKLNPGRVPLGAAASQVLRMAAGPEIMNCPANGEPCNKNETDRAIESIESGANQAVSTIQQSEELNRLLQGGGVSTKELLEKMLAVGQGVAQEAAIQIAQDEISKREKVLKCIPENDLENREPHHIAIYEAKVALAVLEFTSKFDQQLCQPGAIHELIQKIKKLTEEEKSRVHKLLERSRREKRDPAFRMAVEQRLCDLEKALIQAKQAEVNADWWILLAILALIGVAVGAAVYQGRKSENEESQRTLNEFADEVQLTLPPDGKGSVNEITLSNGKKYQARSGFKNRGGVPHVLVQEALDAVPLNRQASWHGECGEVANLTRILDEHPEIKTQEQAKDFFKGSTSKSLFVRPPGDPLHGTYQRPCNDSCKMMLKWFGIDAPKS